MEIPATRASIAQVVRGRGGEMIEIEQHVCNVAEDLRDIRPTLRLRFNEEQAFFVVYDVQRLPDGSDDEHMVTTAIECDQRLVNEVRRIASADYDLVAELDRLEAEGDRQRDSELSDQIGDAAEKLWHAMRADLGVTDRIYVPAKAERALGRG